VARHRALARRLAAGPAAIDGVEVLHAVAPNAVRFALRDGDAARRDRILAALAADGRAPMPPTVRFGRAAVRAAIAKRSTRETGVDLALAAVEWSTRWRAAGLPAAPVSEPVKNPHHVQLSSRASGTGAPAHRSRSRSTRARAIHGMPERLFFTAPQARTSSGAVSVPPASPVLTTRAAR
jgi:hypothetical protein